MINPISAIASLTSKVIDIFVEPSEVKQAKLEAKKVVQLKKIETDKEIQVERESNRLQMVKDELTSDTSLDMESTKQMDRSYKDEFIMFVYYTPMVLVFIPSQQQTVLNGFKAIENMPGWYVGTVVGIAIVTFGLRTLFTRYLDFLQGRNTP